MRFVFMDEAGTSGAREEVVRVVAGVIVHADRQLVRAESALREALSSVPPEFADNFVFHAEDIMNNKKYRDRWRLTDRLNLLKSVMSIPRNLQLGLSYGVVRPDLWGNRLKLGLKDNEEQHLAAFIYCVGKADQYIRERAEPDEIGIIVAEYSDLHRHLGSVPAFLRTNPLVFGPGHFVDRKKDEDQGFNSQNGVLKASRIRETVHFVSKEGDDLVWLADACAYGIKRYFAKKQLGDEYGSAIFGQRLPDIYDFRGLVSGALGWWE